MRRYIEIYSIMLRNSLIRELSFKANFLLWMVVEILWFCGQIVFFSIIFGNVDRIGDWTKWEVVLLIGTHQMIAQLFQAFFFVNVANIPELVRTGKLDSLLVLPIDSQFAVSTKQFSLDSIVNAALGGVVVCVALSRLNIVPNLTSVCLYLIALGFGIAVHYSIMLGLAGGQFLDRPRPGTGLRLFQFPEHRPLSGRYFPMAVPLDFRLDYSSRHYCKHSGTPVNQVARTTLAVDATSCRCFDYCFPPVARLLEICPSALLERQFVGFD